MLHNFDEHSEVNVSGKLIAKNLENCVKRWPWRGERFLRCVIKEIWGSAGDPQEISCCSAQLDKVHHFTSEKKNDIELSINENVVISRKLFIIFSVSSEIQN